MQPRPVWKHPLMIGMYVAIVLVFCLSSAIVYAAYTGALQRFLLSIEPTCTVGLTGSAATMTIIAWSANQDCDDLFAGKTTFLGQGTSDVADLNKLVYRYTGTPTSPVVCELDIKGRHIIVRDEGALKLVGTQLCENLQRLPSS